MPGGIGRMAGVSQLAKKTIPGWNSVRLGANSITKTRKDENTKEARKQIGKDFLAVSSFVFSSFRIFVIRFLLKLMPFILGCVFYRPAHVSRSPAVLWIFLSVFLSPSSFAFAHRLQAEAVVRPFGAVQVETWFETGDSPKEAKVSVFTVDGRLLTEGRCDARGIFVFDRAGNEPLRVVVDAGAGHRAETVVSSAMLTKHTVCTAVACLAPPPSLIAGPLLVPVKFDNPPAPLPLAKRNTGTPLGRLALGVALLLAVAVAVLVRRRLRRVAAGS